MNTGVMTARRDSTSPSVTLMNRKMAADEPKAPLYRVMMVERREPNRFPTLERKEYHSTHTLQSFFLVNVSFSSVIHSDLCNAL